YWTGHGAGIGLIWNGRINNMDNFQWLKDNASFLKISAIERALEMPEGTLKKFIDGRRDLPDKWKLSVDRWVSIFKQ
ncbi:MAG: hypothetical protein J7527_05855, partial [Chitinophagaceae bacterium]|nr:hypothetical protein [Chitinophagaceae bacterium]